MPPLSASTTAHSSTAGTPGGAPEPLRSNGLAGPECDSAASGAVESGACAGPLGVPTSAFGLDINVDTGLLGLGEGALLSVVQQLVIQPLWLALAWLMRALVVVLEWCFALNPLAHGVGTALSTGLARAEQQLTFPWLGFALACAAALTAYDGLVRRHATFALGAAVRTLAMVAVALGVAAQPNATVGALITFSNRSAVALLAVAGDAVGSSGGSLQSDLSNVAERLVVPPWCYLEFGDVSWCLARPSTAPAVDRAALAVAAEAVVRAGCASGAAARARCRQRPDREEQDSLAVAADVRSARTVAALFLAFPPNGTARNDAEQSPSLLNALCGGSELGSCHGATAAQAEFRTASGTWPRLGGLLLIGVGIAGVLAVAGLIAIRLLVAAALTLLLLLATPVVALAPAFGDRGRSLFSAWLTRLTAAATAKLAYAFALGALFTVLALTARLVPDAWWVDWLVTACVAWGLFFYRGAIAEALAQAAGADRSASSGAPGARSGALAWFDQTPLPRVGAVERTANRHAVLRSPELSGPPVAGPSPAPPERPETALEARRRRLRLALVDAEDARDVRRVASLRLRLAAVDSQSPTPSRRGIFRRLATRPREDTSR